MDGITPQERKEAIDALLAEWLDFEKELKTASGVLTNDSRPRFLSRDISYLESWREQFIAPSGTVREAVCAGALASGSDQSAHLCR